MLNTTRVLTDNGSGSGNPVGVIVTTQQWDDSHRLVAQTDDNGNTTSYSYDALNRKIATTYADGTVHSATYDVHDNPITMADANGSVVSCFYDLLDRLVSKFIAHGPAMGPNCFAQLRARRGDARKCDCQACQLSGGKDQSNRRPRNLDRLQSRSARLPRGAPREAENRASRKG